MPITGWVTKRDPEGPACGWVVNCRLDAGPVTLNAVLFWVIAPRVAVRVTPWAHADAEHEVKVANPRVNDALGQLLRVSGIVVPDRLVPGFTLRLTLPDAPVAVLPHESSAWMTTGSPEVAMGTGVEDEEPPTGSVEKASCVAAPGPVTPKAAL